MDMVSFDSAKIWEGTHCSDCGWPIVHVCCNWDYKTDENWDWYAYCSNKGCKNHEGEGMHQDYPVWLCWHGDVKSENLLHSDLQ